MHVVSRKPSLGGALGNALGAVLGNEFAQHRDRQRQQQQDQLQQQQQQKQQQQLSDALGQARQLYENPNLNPEQKQIGLFQALSGRPEVALGLGKLLQGIQGQQIGSQQELMEDQRRYDTIKKNFGERAAELYRAAPEGGKTAFLDRLLETRQRGLGIEDLLGQPQEPSQSSEGFVRGQQNARPEILTEKPPIKALDFDKGLTPKERVHRQEERYGKNLPLYQESQKKLEGLEYEKDSLGILEELSPQIGTMTRLNINPSTGELLIPALASPDAQRYVKTINDFTTKAKDSYGGRVTNFELDRFMKRLPTLANSQDGRKQVIRQMQIVNDINSSREQALHNVLEEHGGIRNIDYDKAEQLADRLSRPQIESLRKEFKAIDKDIEKQVQDKITEFKRKVPKGSIGVQKADGTLGYIPNENLKKFLKIKGNKAL